MRDVTSPFAEWFGLQIVRADQESAEVRLDVQLHHLNKFGNAHGGVCLSLADHACGALLSAIAAEEFYATMTLTSAFYLPVATGELIATAHLAARSRSVAHIDAAIRSIPWFLSSPLTNLSSPCNHWESCGTPNLSALYPVSPPPTLSS